MHSSAYTEMRFQWISTGSHDEAIKFCSLHILFANHSRVYQFCIPNRLKERHNSIHARRSIEQQQKMQTTSSNTYTEIAIVLQSIFSWWSLEMIWVLDKYVIVCGRPSGCGWFSDSYRTSPTSSQRFVFFSLDERQLTFKFLMMLRREIQQLHVLL